MTMASRVLALRRSDTCEGCKKQLDAGERAWWDAENKKVWCLNCDRVRRVPPALVTSVPGNEQLNRGVAGKSALAEHERRYPGVPLPEFKPRSQLQTAFRAMRSNRRTPSKWAKGGEGEQRVGARLEQLLDHHCVILHDRGMPGKKWNIDHLIIAGSGVWIVDSKNYSGKIELRNVGGRSASNFRMHVNGRNRSNLIDGFEWQTQVVTMALGDTPPPIHSALCFVEVEWPLFYRPVQQNDVWIIWARALAKKIAAPGPLDESAVQRVARQLAEQLPAK